MLRKTCHFLSTANSKHIKAINLHQFLLNSSLDIFEVGCSIEFGFYARPSHAASERGVIISSPEAYITFFQITSVRTILRCITSTLKYSYSIQTMILSNPSPSTSLAIRILKIFQETKFLFDAAFQWSNIDLSRV